jgi:signal transduction histidine kinase
MQRHLMMVLAAVLVLSVGVAMILASRITGPLRELTAATREVARTGALERPVPVHSADEIGQLGDSFNTMLRELKQAREELLIAEKFAFIGEVAAGVAHEVRTPLGIMRSAAQLLQRGLGAQPASAELVETIIGEVDRLNRVVDGLLQLARPREPVPERTRVEAVLTRALDLAAAQAREKGIAIERQFADRVPPAWCDPEQIHQVALNLIVNALQILPRGGHITVRTDPNANGRVAFEIEDNGPGIPAELHERIFTPFFSLREGGSGLGLALVQRVVQSHHGSVSVRSTPGRGAAFRVELPVAKEET